MAVDTSPTVPGGASGSGTAQPVGRKQAAEEPRVFVASQWQLIWWKFRKHKLALISAGIVALVYLVALFVEPIAPFLPDNFNSKFTYAPPQAIHLFSEGRFVGPYAYGLKQEIEPVALRRIFKPDPK